MAKYCDYVENLFDIHHLSLQWNIDCLALKYSMCKLVALKTMVKRLIPGLAIASATNERRETPLEGEENCCVLSMRPHHYRNIHRDSEETTMNIVFLNLDYLKEKCNIKNENRACGCLMSIIHISPAHSQPHMRTHRTTMAISRVRPNRVTSTRSRLTRSRRKRRKTWPCPQSGPSSG